MDARDKYSLLSSLLYLVSITFVIFKVFGNLEGPTRIGIFWVLLLFTAVNIVNGSFGSNASRRKLYHYQLYDPIEIFISKIILNFFKLLIAGIVLLILFKVFSNAGLKNPLLFGKTLVLAVLGIVSSMTLISSLTIYSSNQSSLLTILALPLLIPVLLIGMKVSLVSENMFFDTAVDSNLLMLLGIDLIMLVMGIIFISITWKA